jgi:plastocyanin
MTRSLGQFLSHVSRSRRLSRLRRLVALAGAAALFAPAMAAGPRTYTVVMEGIRFVPETLEVQRGDTVEWVNRDVVPHTVTAAGAFDSGSIAPEARWKRVMGRAGTVAYVCTFHPTMKATLTVR